MKRCFSDIGEQVSLRQFDISDRTAIASRPSSRCCRINCWASPASVGVGREHRPDAAFGLRDNDLRASRSASTRRRATSVAIGASYGFEHYTTLQRSRQANPGAQFDDPTRDWSTDMDERVHTFTANVHVPHLDRADDASSSTTITYVPERNTCT